MLRAVTRVTEKVGGELKSNNLDVIVIFIGTGTVQLFNLCLDI